MLLACSRLDEIDFFKCIAGIIIIIIIYNITCICIMLQENSRTLINLIKNWTKSENKVSTKK